MINMEPKSIERIYKYLNDNKIFPEDVRKTYDDIADVNYTVVGISWGDWKHEHQRCKHLMYDLGYICEGSIVTEEDGSDCYSADHYFVRMA